MDQTTFSWKCSRPKGHHNVVRSAPSTHTAKPASCSQTSIQDVLAEVSVNGKYWNQILYWNRIWQYSWHLTTSSYCQLFRMMKRPLPPSFSQTEPAHATKLAAKSLQLRHHVEQIPQNFLFLKSCHWKSKFFPAKERCCSWKVRSDARRGSGSVFQHSLVFKVEFHNAILSCG